MGLEKVFLTQMTFISYKGALNLILLRTRLDWLLIPALALKELKIARSRQSFSQFGEDIELKKLCPPTGLYIDIGSGRPVSGSNTYFLYKSGWSGVLVDPIFSNMLLSRLIRPRDKKFQAVVGGAQDIYFYHLLPYEYSTTSPEIVESLLESKKARLISKTRLKSIEIAKLFNSPITSCMLLCIDAEGQDFEILRSFPFQLQKPDLICVEDNVSDFGSEINNFLTKKGYRLHKRVGLSAIYVLTGSQHLNF